jgi:glycine dehydrogenase subunit 1
MRYIPLTEQDRIDMLKTVGKNSIRELFDDIPAEFLLNRQLNLPAALSEWDLMKHMEALLDKNAACFRYPCFLGAGAYRHFIPSVVSNLASRSEFVTAYTPYQPEISQGTLQGIFEYQTMMTQLTGLPVSNASLYDGAMSAAEAALMAVRIQSKQPCIAISRALAPGYRRTLATYCKNLGIDLIEIPVSDSGETDHEEIEAALQRKPAAIMIQSPNYFGVIEDIGAISKLRNEDSTLLIAVVSEALSMGILKSPGECGADIVCGEAQSLGIPLSFGGPYLGFFTAKEKFIRFMPGRLVGMTKDSKGRTGFVNTLSTREQHIRREKATSNICTNQALCAMTAGIFMATMGPAGLRELAMLNMKKSAYLKSKIDGLDGFSCVFSGHTFNEFAVKVPGSARELDEFLFRNGIIGGLDLSDDYPELGDTMLFCATEINARDDIDKLEALLHQWTKEIHS